LIFISGYYILSDRALEGHEGMESDYKPKAKDNLTIQDLGDETLIYDPERDNVHVLNATAQAIWNLCDGSHTIKDIQKTLSNI